MKIRGAVRFSMVLLAALLALPASAAEEAPPTSGRVYKVEYLDVNEAGLYARQVCLEQSHAECDFSIRGRGFLEIWADAETLDKVGRMLAERDVPPKTQVFQVTLLIASNDGRPDPDIPDFARKALEDIRSLLPFRGYRVLDTGLMRTSRDAYLSLGGDLGYRATLRFQGDEGAGRPLYIEKFELEQSYVRWVQPPPKVASGGKDGTTVMTEGAERENISRRVVEASFAMDVGETVVVGTSKLDGGSEALVILLTALE